MRKLLVPHIQSQKHEVKVEDVRDWRHKFYGKVCCLLDLFLMMLLGFLFISLSWFFFFDQNCSPGWPKIPWQPRLVLKSHSFFCFRLSSAEIIEVSPRVFVLSFYFSWQGQKVFPVSKPPLAVCFLCPYEVTRWLANGRMLRGHPLSSRETGWGRKTSASSLLVNGSLLASLEWLAVDLKAGLYTACAN